MSPTYNGGTGRGQLLETLRFVGKDGRKELTVLG